MSNNFIKIPVKELFRIENTQSCNKDAISEGQEYDYITRTVNNRGIISKTGHISGIEINEADTFSLELLTCMSFFRERPWYAGQFIKKICPKDKRIVENWMYFETLLQKLSPLLSSVLVRDVDEMFLESSLLLPVDSIGNIDYRYIEEFTEKITNEKKKIARNYIKTIKKGAKKPVTIEINYKPFMIDDLFYKVKTPKRRKIDKKRDVSTEKTPEFSLPLVNAKIDNNGIMYYGRPADFVSADMSLDIIQNGAIATGKVFAQPQATGVLWDAYLIKPKDTMVEINENHLLYFSTLLEKRIRESFDRDTKATWDRVKALTVLVPVDDNSNPNWEYIDQYICSIKKSVITKVAI